MANGAVIPSERSESRDLHLWILTESAESTENRRQSSASSALSVRNEEP